MKEPVCFSIAQECTTTEPLHEGFMKELGPARNLFSRNRFLRPGAGCLSIETGITEELARNQHHNHLSGKGVTVGYTLAFANFDTHTSRDARAPSRGCLRSKV